MAVNLCAAHKKTDSRASYNRAAHKDGSHAAHEIAPVLYTKINSCITCEFGLSHLTKIGEHTHVAARECQLRCELYRSIFDHINFGIIFHIVTCLRSFMSTIHKVSSQRVN